MRPSVEHLIAADVSMMPRWDVAECLAALTEIGLEGIGLASPMVEAFGTARAAEAVAASDLRVVSFSIDCPFAIGSPEDFAARREVAARQLDLAVALDAECVYFVSGPREQRRWDDAFRVLVDQAPAVVAMGRERGLRLAIEPIHPLRQDVGFVNLIESAMALIAAVDDPSFGYVYDFFHCWWQPLALEHARTTTGSIFLAQPCDQKRLTLRMMDRAPIGQGVAGVRDIIAALIAGGYDGVYDIEIMSEDNEQRGYDSVMNESAERLHVMLDELTTDATGA